MSSPVLSLPKIPWRAVRRIVFIAVSAFLVAGVLAPWIDGSHWSAAIRKNLEQTLGRKVEFEKVHFTLFTGPGFSLENVTIGEDPRFGLEPFAFVPTMQVRLRPDKLLLGQIRLATLRLVEPSLNLVKRSDGTWNVIELVRRLSAPRRSPLHLFPVFEVEDGRVDFKFGNQKTTLYLLNAGVAVYPERSGLLTLRFSGSPARTDRAGHGFGHLRGQAKWHIDATREEDALQADVNLDPSNLGEMTTLVEGHDLGVHGTVSSSFRAVGPLQKLRMLGTVHFTDLHRWDLIPVNGEDWNIRYGGTADLVSHRLNIETWGKAAESAPPERTPVSLVLQVNDFLTRPVWALTARMSQVPLTSVLPLGRRMGLNLPRDLTVAGNVDGEVTLNSGSGVQGSATLRDVSATLPNTPPLNAEIVNVSIQQDRVHFDKTTLQTAAENLQLGGDYFLMTPKADASIATQDFPVTELKAALSPWLGMPANFDLLHDGKVSGQLIYAKNEDNGGVWSGKMHFAGATLKLPGLAKPLREAEGQVIFDESAMEVPRFSSMAGERSISGSYRYLPAALHPEHLRMELPAMELSELQALLAPTLEPQNWLARLHVTKRVVPSWLANRNMEGDLLVKRFFVNEKEVGSLAAHFFWRGVNLQFSKVGLNSLVGSLQAQGTISLASYSPDYSFSAQIRGLRWGGGRLAAEGTVQTTGIGSDVLGNLQSSGTFSGENLTLTPDDTLDRVSGDFTLSFADGWPDLRLPAVRAGGEDEPWTGEGAAQNDGKLVLKLERAGQQRQIVTSILPDRDSTLSRLNQTLR